MPSARNLGPYSPSSRTETIAGSNLVRSRCVTTRKSIASAPPTPRPVVTKLIRRGRVPDVAIDAPGPGLRHVRRRAVRRLHQPWYETGPGRGLRADGAGRR